MTQALSVLFPLQSTSEWLLPEEWEKRLGVTHLSQLHFLDEQTEALIRRRCSRVVKRGDLLEEQKWRGAFFGKEIEEGWNPLLELRWMAPSIGFGVFAKRDLSERSYIAEYTGILRKKKFFEDPSNSYCFDYWIGLKTKGKFFIDALKKGGIARFINHSSRPNVEPLLVYWKGLFHLILITKRKIARGEQLVYDYGDVYWQHRQRPYHL